MIKCEDKYFIYDKNIHVGLKYYIKKVLYNPISFLYKLTLFFKHPKNQGNKKYNVSVCAIFKNEAQYLKEWIEYNHLIGIDHFYLYNNNSEDSYKEELQSYIDSGLVTLLQWEKNQAQMECYRDGISRYKNETKWVCFIDIDEFIVPLKNKNIYDFLKQYDNTRGAVVCYWKMFCSSGLADRDRSKLVVESFYTCWPKMDSVGKCFYNTSFDFIENDFRNNTLHHFMWTSYKGVVCPPVNTNGNFLLYGIHKINKKEFFVQINHYFTKSYQEYREKKAKGDVYFKINPHDESYFQKHEMLCTDVDYTIFKYIILLKQKMGIIK